MTSRFRTYALRRTPPTDHTPYATKPPILRILYVWFNTPEGESPVVMLMGDKTEKKNLWYPTAVSETEHRLIPQWESQHPEHKAQVKRKT